MILSKICLDISKIPLRQIQAIRREKFWSSNLLSQFDRNTIKYCILQQYLLWLFALVTLINIASPSFPHPKFIYRNYWSLNAKIAYNIFFFLYSTCGYYIGNSVEMYYSYTVLHSYFQVKMIGFYIKRELTVYKTMPFNEKIYSSSYQKAVNNILLQSIQQYQLTRRLFKVKLLKLCFIYNNFRYMNIATSMCNNVAPFHFLAGIPVISIGVHGILFVSTLQKIRKFYFLLIIAESSIKHIIRVFCDFASWLWCYIIQ